MNRTNSTYRVPVHRAEHGNLNGDEYIIKVDKNDKPNDIIGIIQAVPHRTVFLHMLVMNAAQAGLIVDIGYRDLNTGVDYPAKYAADLSLAAASPVGGKHLISMPYHMGPSNTADANANVRTDLIIRLKSQPTAVQSFSLVTIAKYPGV